MREIHSVTPDACAEVAASLAVTHIDVQIDIFNKMLHGWDTQMAARNVKQDGREDAIALVRRFAQFCNSYPWDWTPEDFEAWSHHLTGTLENPGSVVFSTLRSYQGAIRRFNDYTTDPNYGWIRMCEARFQRSPAVIVNEYNTVTHTDEFEGRPERRALTYEELQTFFDAADSLVDRARSSGHKGSLAAMRNSALLKDMYVHGTRRNEQSRQDLTDMRHQPHMPEWREFGARLIRHGKAKRHGPPRRRTVLLIPEFDWIVPTLEQYLARIHRMIPRI